MSLRFALAANCSTLFRDRAFNDRFTAAGAAGFRLVESWWPFTVPDPGAAESAAFVSAVGRGSVTYSCMNLYAGDLDSGDRGIVNASGRVREFRDGVASAVALGALVGCRRFNALYGLEPDESSRAWSECAIDNLTFAAEAVQQIDASIVLEPLCRNGRYGLRRPEAAVELVRQMRAAGHTNVGLLADLYHLGAAIGDVPGFIEEHIDLILHVQIADDPGRGAPGSGRLPLLDWLRALQANRYAGAVGLEYFIGAQRDPFAWIQQWSSAMGPIDASRSWSSSELSHHPASLRRAD
jgi:hydroxypyruvate isomerase